MATTRLIPCTVTTGKLSLSALPTEPNMPRIRTKPTAVNSLAVMPAIRRRWMQSSCYPNANTAPLPGEHRKAMSSHTSFVSPSSRVKSRPKKPTKSDTSWHCGLRSNATPSSWPHMSTSTTSTTISSSTLHRWTARASSATSSAAALPSANSAIRFAWSTAFRSSKTHRAHTGITTSGSAMRSLLPSGIVCDKLSTPLWRKSRLHSRRSSLTCARSDMK